MVSRIGKRAARRRVVVERARTACLCYLDQGPYRGRGCKYANQTFTERLPRPSLLVRIIVVQVKTKWVSHSLLPIVCSTHIKNSPFDTLDSYGLMEDANALAERINASTLKHEYSWLASHITASERANAIGDQSGRLKELKRPGEVNSPQSARPIEP